MYAYIYLYNYLNYNVTLITVARDKNSEQLFCCTTTLKLIRVPL